MIESPSATLYVPAPTEDTDAPLADDKKKNVDQEQLLVLEEPITSSISKTEKHLVARAGRLSRFRGITMRAFRDLCTARLARLVMHILPLSLISAPIAFIAAEVALANFSLAWTHIVITESSTKYWFQRIPSFRLWKKVAVPTLIMAVVEQLILVVPTYLSAVWLLNDPNAVLEDKHLGQKVVFIALLAFATTILVGIPAQVTLTRVQASLLSEEQETIVPFDRSFGGKVVTELAGGSGMISLLEAWKTFDVRSRVRLIKLYCKVFAMQSAVTIFYTVATLGFLFAKMGPEITNAISKAQKDNEMHILDV